MSNCKRPVSYFFALKAKGVYSAIFKFLLLLLVCSATLPAQKKDINKEKTTIDGNILQLPPGELPPDDEGGPTNPPVALLTNEQRKAFLHYYSPIILKRSQEGGNWTNRFNNDFFADQRGWDWMTNWYFDNQAMQNSYDKRGWGGHNFSDNGTNWRNKLGQYIDSRGVGFSDWDIRPTIYTSLLEFMENDANGIPRKCLILMYHPYHARDLYKDGKYKIHDWEAIVMRINNVNTSPGNGETISYATITMHSKDGALRYLGPETNSGNKNLYFYDTPNGKHLLVWRAESNYNKDEPYHTVDGWEGAELKFVTDASIKTKLNSSTIYGYVPVYDPITDTFVSVNFHYAFVDENAHGAVQEWNAQALTSANANTLYSGKNPNQPVNMSQVKRITYELQDISDIIPTMDHDYDWKDASEAPDPLGTCDLNQQVYEMSDFVTPVTNENGSIVEVPSDNNVRVFYPEARGDDRRGYITKDWFSGKYGMPWCDEHSQHRYLPMRQLGMPDRYVDLSNLSIVQGWSGNAQIQEKYEMANDWYVSTKGGFDGRWVQLFEDSKLPFLPEQTDVTNLYGMDGQKWGADRRTAHVGDFNGDGKKDVILQGSGETMNTYLLIANASNGFTLSDITDNTSMAVTGRTWGSNRRLLHVGDFNGDGKKDVLLQSVDDQNNAYVLYGQATSPYFGKAQDLTALYGISMRTMGNDRRRALIGDYNGDGRDDFILQGRDNDKDSYLLLGKATGGFEAPVSLNTSYGMDKQKWGADRRIAHIGDFNADGRKDILLQGTSDVNNTYLLMAKTGGTAGNYFESVVDVSANNVYGMDKQKWGNDRRNLYLGDFNGDGRKDVLLQGNADNHPTYILMAKTGGTLNNYFENVISVTDSFGMSAWTWCDDRRVVHILDFDGNGRQDILLRGKNNDNNTYVLLANTVSRFDDPLEISYAYSMDMSKWADEIPTSLGHVGVIGDYNNDGREDILLQGRWETATNHLILAQPNFQALINGPTSLNANVTGTWTASTNPPNSGFTYKWYKNNVLVSTASSYSTSSSSNFSLKLEATNPRYGTKASALINVVVNGVILAKKSNDLPLVFALHENYPNPFNPTTTIRYDLKSEVKVSLKIYNILGQEIRTLVNQIQPAGHWSALWDGRNNTGSQVASGIYIYRLVSGDFISSKKMLLIK